jgi:hypothetical protein
VLRPAAEPGHWPTGDEYLELRPLSPELAGEWLARCLGINGLPLERVSNLKSSPQREVWDCTFSSGGTLQGAVVTLFRPGSLDCVNTNLPPAQAAQKCALAMAELPGLGVPTPRLLGYATSNREAAVATEKIAPIKWESAVRIQAARVLARLHSLPETSLSQELQELVRRSDSKEQRTTGGRGPRSPYRTLVHGDYFSANILPVADGLRVIDWETLGWGDPMWDLGFLIGADPNVPWEEVQEVIGAYESLAPVDRHYLIWHQQRWRDLWTKWAQESANQRLEAMR